jgi:3-hydroxy-3-methylglutaryl CoA synthase
MEYEVSQSFACLYRCCTHTFRYSIDPHDIGRLEVGTETLIDKSKSTKTVLMELFAASGQTDIEGATIVNACYGGTAAFLNALAWCNDNDDDVESEGREKYAIVVAADIAAYEAGAARPTSGCGAVAILVGRDAPLAYRSPRATHAAHVYDFYKPDHAVEYPVVDGALSQLCYYRALEDVYERFVQKQQSKKTKDDGHDGVDTFTAETPDYWVFHAPYNKLVQKSYGRLFLLDARRQYQQRLQQQQQRARDEQPEQDDEKKCEPAVESTASCNDKQQNMLAEWLTKPIAETYNDPTLDGVLKQLSKDAFQQRLSDANAASKMVGNTYTASVFLGLASLLDRCGGDGTLLSTTPGKSVAVFSYGSGALATLYRLETYVSSSFVLFLFGFPRSCFDGIILFVTPFLFCSPSVCTTDVQPPTNDADQVYDPAYGRDDATIKTVERTTVEGCRVRTGRGTGNTRADALCCHPTVHSHLRDRPAVSGHVLPVGSGRPMAPDVRPRAARRDAVTCPRFGPGAGPRLGAAGSIPRRR